QRRQDLREPARQPARALPGDRPGRAGQRQDRQEGAAADCAGGAQRGGRPQVGQALRVGPHRDHPAAALAASGHAAPDHQRAQPAGVLRTPAGHPAAGPIATSASCTAESLVSAEPSLLGPREEQRWLLQYLPLVKRIVSQLSLQASSALDREDMEQIGLLGLLDSLRRYGQPDEGFARFAGLRVRGAILDELRRQDWRPRGVRQQTHKLRDAVRELTRSLGREPTDEEILAHTGLSEEAYQGYLVDLSC